MQVVIFCGGLATRLGSLSKHIPKSMIEVQGKPFLSYQLDQLKHHKITDVVLCVGHLSKHIQSYFKDGSDFGVHITYSYDTEKLLGPIGALKHAEPHLTSTFFTLYGDSYVFVNYKDIHSYFKEKKAKALMTVYHNNDKYDQSNLVINNDRVIQYGGQKTAKMTYIDYGVSLFHKSILDDIPNNAFCSTADFYTKVVQKHQLYAYEVDTRFYHIGTPTALTEFKTYIQENS